MRNVRETNSVISNSEEVIHCPRSVYLEFEADLGNATPNFGSWSKVKYFTVEQPIPVRRLKDHSATASEFEAII
jgi:hypothetical protein